MAGAAAGPDGLRRLAVPVLLGLRGQPAAGQPSTRSRTEGLLSKAELKKAPGVPGAPRWTSARSRPSGCRCWARPSSASRPTPPPRSAQAFDAFCERESRVARRLRAVHGAQGRARRRRLASLAAGRSSCARPEALAEARVRLAKAVRARAVLRSTCSSSSGARLRAALPRARHPHHGRHADLRRPRQRRRLGPPRAVPPRGRRHARARRGRAARLLQRHRPALGQPALPLGRASRGTGYRWWIERFRAALGLVDLVRLDHFRGFEAYWEVPGGEPTAIERPLGEGPGRGALRGAARRALGTLPIVAENLGVITPEVEALRAALRLPGHGHPAVRLRQRRLGRRASSPTTTRATWSSTPAPTTTTRRGLVERRRRRLHAHPGGGRRGAGATRAATSAPTAREIHWDFIRAVLASVADTAIVPLQDVLGLGSEARMNLPGRAAGNWRGGSGRASSRRELRARLRRARRDSTSARPSRPERGADDDTSRASASGRSGT